MKAIWCSLLIAMVAFHAATLSAAEPPIRVFIRGGVKTHGPDQHDHPRFLKDWTALLNERGAKATGGMQFPTKAELNDTDVVVIYAADGMKITGENRTDFEAFLRRGGGLVVIHDGVVSGEENAWAKTIQGGAWVWANRQTKWYEGEVGVYFVDTDHPITRGISNFDWQDEIYYELDMAPEAKVLATSFHSVFVLAPQLWTYERTMDGGTKPYRSFVSLPGHQYVTFNTPHYRAILLRGIAWAAQRSDTDHLCSKEELASLRYPAGGPTRPEEAARKLTLHPDFKLNLVAAEPLIEKPISFDWDPSGRLWIAETPEYPSGRTVNKNDQMVALWAEKDPSSFKNSKEDRPAKDRISWVEDTDGDGRVDRKHVFYEGLELVTSLVFHRDGVIVAQAPDILWIRDTDGDGRGDKVEKLYTGFGTGDTHAVLNNLRWGMDGWVYGAVGYSGGDPRSADGETRFGRHSAAIYRFKPDGKMFEILAATGCNTWGFDFGWDGEMYYTTPTCGDHAIHIALPETVLARGQIGGVRAQNPMQDHNRVKPLVRHTRPAYVQIDVVGGFTAASGACVYNGGAWPTRYDNSFFVSEPTVSLLHQDFLQPKQSSYTASKEPGREDAEFFAGTDLWFRPIHQRIGPDGALYVADFYNQAVIHNDTRGPKHGANNAATRPDRDHHFGRIWRIQHNEAKALGAVDLASAKPAELVAALDHPNGWVRMTAHRLLSERADVSTADALGQLARAGKTAAGRLHAVWALHNLGRLEPTVLVAAINDASPAVRKNALRAAAEEKRDDQATVKAVTDQLTNADPRVVLQALATLGGSKPSADVVKSLIVLWPSLPDRYLQSAAIGVAAAAPLRFLQAAMQSADPTPYTNFVLFVVKDWTPKAGADEISRLIGMLGGADAKADNLKLIIVETVAAGLKPDSSVEWSAPLQAALDSLLRSNHPELPGATLPLIARWDKAGSMTKEVKPLITQLTAKLADNQSSDADRSQAAVYLLGVRRYDAALPARVAQLLGDSESPTLQRRIIDALGAMPEAQSGDLLATAWPNLATGLHDAAFSQIVKRADWSRALLEAIAAGKADLLTVSPSALHRLRTHADKGVAQRTSEIVAQIRGPSQQEKDKLVEELLPAMAKNGDLEKGKVLFDQNCGVCHPFKGTGRNIAPDLTGMGVHGMHELLTHIVDPNRLVEPNYVSVSIETKDDNSFDGVIASENRASVKLRNASGDTEIRTADIKSRRSTGRSLMPEGFEALGAEGLRDLLYYMSADDRRFRVLDLRSAFTADSTRGIYNSREATEQSLRFRKFGLLKAGEIPFEIVSPTKTTEGNNVVVLKGGQGLAYTFPQRVEVTRIGVPAAKLHFLGGVGGWAWPVGGNKAEGLKVAKVTVQFADGEKEEFVLTNGVEFADYNGRTDVPGSKALSGVVERGQIRWFTKPLKHRGIIDKIVLESFANQVAPTFVAITAEAPE